MTNEVILGIWDGHDAGAALIRGDEIPFAVNEERLTRRKLEVGFPKMAVKACLNAAGLAPADIKIVAASTTDPAKTLTRIFPKLKDEYYLIRRRKLVPRPGDRFKKAFKYRFTELSPNPLSRMLSRAHLEGQLKAMRFTGFHLELVDHHAAHAAAAALCSGFPETAVLTLDGVGDGLCGTVWTWKHGNFDRIAALPSGRSLGIFFEHVTNLMNMRELEDEGKVMALASFACPIPDNENPMRGLIGVQGLDIVSLLNAMQMYRELKAILWRYPAEQFAAMAQRVLEKSVVALARATLEKTGLNRLAVAGGVFSNIKMNMRLSEIPGLARLYVFPHMGDGGLAIGAALEVNRRLYGANACLFANPFLGPGYSINDSKTIQEFVNPDRKTRTDCTGSANALKEDRRNRPKKGFETNIRKKEGFFSFKDDVMRVVRLKDPSAEAARLILSGEVILWFQGRMEIGPRALGHRSILARPDDRRIKDRLNLLLKKRVWYQPFCPSMLIEDAPLLLETEGQELGDNRFMTMGYRVRPERLALMEGVINVDGVCRPHFVAEEDPRYRVLLGHIKETLGYGVVLNTSLNLHGDPMICSPAEAVAMLRETEIRYLIMEEWLIEKTHASIL